MKSFGRSYLLSHNSDACHWISTFDFDTPVIDRVDARLQLMKHLDMEVSDRDATVIEARIHEHVRSLDALDAL